MATREPALRRVALWARCLAGIVAASGIGVLLVFLYLLLEGRALPGFPPVLGLIAALWIVPLFALVAVTGRVPRYWPGSWWR